MIYFVTGRVRLYVEYVWLFSARANSCTFCKQFVTLLWQFLDGHCLKCWVSMVAVIFFVTLPLEHLLYCLPTASHKCHNTDKYNNSTWHSSPRMYPTVAVAYSAHSHQQVAFNQWHQEYWWSPTSGQLNDILWHLTPNLDHLHHLIRHLQAQTHSYQVNKSFTDEVRREHTFNPFSAALALSTINAADLISPSWLLCLSPACHILQNLPQQCIHTIYDLIRGHNE